MLSSTSSGLSMTADLSIFRKCGRTGVMWDDEEAMVLFWSKSHMGTCNPVTLHLSTATLHGMHTERREKKPGNALTHKRWCEPLNTTDLLLPCPTNTFTLTPYKTETLLFQPRLLEYFTVTNWPNSHNPTSLSLFYRNFQSN